MKLNSRRQSRRQFVKLRPDELFLSQAGWKQQGSRTVCEVVAQCRVGGCAVTHHLLITSDNVSLTSGNLPPSSQHLKLCWRECKVRAWKQDELPYIVSPLDVQLLVGGPEDSSAPAALATLSSGQVNVMICTYYV